MLEPFDIFFNSRLLTDYCKARAVLNTASFLIQWLNNSSFSSKSPRHLPSLTVGARDMEFWENVYPPSCVTCKVTHVTGIVAHVIQFKYFSLFTFFWIFWIFSSMRDFFWQSVVAIWCMPLMKLLFLQIKFNPIKLLCFINCPGIPYSGFLCILKLHLLRRKIN